MKTVTVKSGTTMNEVAEAANIIPETASVIKSSNSAEKEFWVLIEGQNAGNMKQVKVKVVVK